MFMDIGRSTPRHQAIAVLYPQSPKLQSYLFEYFIVVVVLCRYLFRFAQKSTLQQFTSSLNDGNLKLYQNDLNTWASSIEREMQVCEAQENAGFRALSRSIFKSASHKQRLATNSRVLDFCSTYDHETVWKQTRKAGNTLIFEQLTEYREWKDSLHSCTLLFTGKLGSGKSVLLANIVDDLSLSMEKDQPLVAYFFCRHDVLESLRARTILGSLARQLLRTLFDLKFLSGSCENAYSTDDVEKISHMVLQGFPTDQKAYFVVDGLDECDLEERELLVQEVQKIQTKLNVLVCASSRIESNNSLHPMTSGLLLIRIVPLPEENPDIEVFIEAKLRHCLERELLTIGDATLIVDIQDTLVAGSQGMFLWPDLQIQSLCSMKTDHAIREALTDLPESLSQTFARILHKSGRPDRPLQTKILQVVLAACRPFRISELREALSVIPGDANWDRSKLLNNVYVALAYCGCLLTVDEEESTVRVVHHSVKQYLLQSLNDGEETTFSSGYTQWTSLAVKRIPLLKNPRSTRLKKRNPETTFFGNAQRTLADIVITYLGYGIFETQLSRDRVHPLIAESAPSNILQSTMGTSSATRQLAMKILGSRKQSTFDLSKTLAEARGSFRENPKHKFRLYDYAKTYWQDHVWYISGHDRRMQQLSIELIQSRAYQLERLDEISHHLFWAQQHGNAAIVDLLFSLRKKDKEMAERARKESFDMEKHTLPLTRT